MSTDFERYDPVAIEEKWQAEWAEHGTNTFTTEALRAQEILRGGFVDGDRIIADAHDGSVVFAIGNGRVSQ